MSYSALIFLFLAVPAGRDAVGVSLSFGDTLLDYERESYNLTQIKTYIFLALNHANILACSSVILLGQS